MLFSAFDLLPPDRTDGVVSRLAYGTFDSGVILIHANAWFVQALLVKGVLAQEVDSRQRKVPVA